MMSIQSIEESVRKLPKKGLAEFRRWFEEFDAEVWDSQFERDASGGKLDGLVDEALKHLKDEVASHER